MTLKEVQIALNVLRIMDQHWKDLFELGLCRFTDILQKLNYIKFDDSVYFREYIRFNRPNDGFPFYAHSTGQFWFPQNEVWRRKIWVKWHIWKLKREEQRLKNKYSPGTIRVREIERMDGQLGDLTVIGPFVKHPTVGEPFWVGEDFRTATEVTEVISFSKFRTPHAVYQIEEL